MVRKDGAVCLDWQQIAKVDPVSMSETTVLWNQPGVQAAGVDKEAILAEFNREVEPTEPLQWSL